MIVGELSQNELQSYLDIQNRDRCEAIGRIHQNIRSLCLTSKRVESIARPLLFRTITVSSPKQLLLLYSALLEKTQLGFYIREISLEILPKSINPKDFLPLPSGALTLLTTPWESPGRELDTEDHEYPAYYCDQILSLALYSILRRAPDTQKLVLRIQQVSFRYPEDREKDLTFAYEPFFRRVQFARARAEFLPRLKTLQLLGDPELPGKMVIYDICAPLFQSSTLENIAVSQVLGLLDDSGCEVSSASDKALGTIKTAELRDCLCGDRELRGFGSVFPNLESFKLSLMMDDFCNSSDANGARGENRFEDLEGSLRKMKSLHTLNLEFSHTFKAIDMSKLPAEGLSLASLVNLAILRIPLMILAGGDDTTSWSIGSRLARNLPRYLKHLTVSIEVSSLTHWYGDGATDVSSATSTQISTILGFIEALSSLGTEVFPHLKEVVCCYTMKGYRRRQEIEIAEATSTDLEEADLFGLDEDSSQRLEKLRRSVRRSQIRFSVAYEELYGNIESRDGGWA
ncbi:hypothetical protein KVR01_003420 [Diaporthe batatas]|uniref:uncharacterized protein n=1 Tax=Diaporthe batatas TaxID=748121 RepID=UPI001D04E311|nr:uncharacterized protein KVR01_003420 [Diaporthe batatas]KAG8167731.1 hypothetical protein KVR01_003420 [Diaporthe batatas]